MSDQCSTEADGVGAEICQLRLYVAGQGPKSKLAMKTLQSICDKHLAGRCVLEIVDLWEEPARAAADQILAIPTLVKFAPTPRRLMVGDLTNREHVMHALRLCSA
jgi:circadian clock protein KaiB